ncbi:MAG: amidase [Proteobacteria bacterium]|nr:amidase [Pseudomonadota bacterium]
MTYEEYARCDALELARLVRGGEIRAEELLELAIARATEVDPRIGSIVIELHDRARAAIARGLPDGPLRGVPFLVKDLQLQIGGTRTTGGSRFFRDAVASFDSTLIQRYERAGLVIFGRSASPELGLTTTTESALFGATRNPWNLEHIAGGSSGGSAAAVAAGITPIASASDGGGSIRIPASCCGLFGLKPTRMRVPLGPGNAEGWNGLSVSHAVTRSVRDSAALLDVSHGPDLGDPYAAPPPARPFLSEVGEPPGNLSIALMRAAPSGAEVHPECLAAIDAAARLCESLGHRVEEAMPELDYFAIGMAMVNTISTETRLKLEERAAELGRELREDDVEPVTWRIAERADSLDALTAADARHTIHRASLDMARFQQRYDVVLSPPLAKPPERLGVLGLSIDFEDYAPALAAFSPFCSFANITGVPAMSVPLHWSQGGLPVGAMFMGRFGDEATLLRLAAQLEQAQPWAGRRPPL